MVQIHPDPPVSLSGGVAQLGERLLCKQEVIGSIPFTSTILIQSEVVKRRVAFSALSTRLLIRTAVLLFNNTEEVKVSVCLRTAGVVLSASKR